MVVVGAGAVGSTFAYSLLHSGLANEIALFDANQDHARGQVLDLVHGLPFAPPVSVHLGDASDYADAHVIVITAGAKQQPGESRLNLLQRNADIIRGIMDDLCAWKSPGVVVVVSNPVDVA